jgi:hypothetical protein
MGINVIKESVSSLGKTITIKSSVSSLGKTITAKDCPTMPDSPQTAR